MSSPAASSPTTPVARRPSTRRQTLVPASFDSPSLIPDAAASAANEPTTQPTTPTAARPASSASMLRTPPTPTPRRTVSLHNLPPPTPRNPPPPTDIIDEFAGLSFPALLTPYLSTPSALPEAIDTASTLLERLYTAYLQRTDSLRDLYAEVDVLKETLAAQQAAIDVFKAQNDKLTARLEEADSQHEAEAAALRRELQRREAVDEELRVLKRRSNPASDSGFESDADSASMFSRGEAGEAEREERAVGGLSPLREAWSPGEEQKGGVWGFFKGKRQAGGAGGFAWGRPDVETLRQENRWLKGRVAELEGAVEMALEAVAGRTR